MDDVLTLLRYTLVKDAYGVQQKGTPEEVPVYCKAESVTRSEFFNAGRSGLNPEFRFTMFAGDYSGETELMYRGKGYSVYRTYHVPGTDYIELYVERKGGSNAEESRT